MTDQIIERPTTETDEIERHKYFLSEKAGHDVGWETAKLDWESNFAPAFRSEQLPEPRNIIVETPTVEKPNKPNAPRVDDAERPAGFAKVLKRIFKRGRSRNR